MFEQLAKQLQNSQPQPQPLYARLTLSLVVFSLFTGYFLYQQIPDRVEILSYQQQVLIGSAHENTPQVISYLHE